MRLNITKHKNILIKILKDIYSDPILGASLGFKGGTAALLFYNLPRFSVDLDFDLLNIAEKDYVFNKVKEIAARYGKIKQAEKKMNYLFILLSYEDEKNNIKIEINFRNFGSKFEVKSYLGIPMKIMRKDDMFANKLTALYERKGSTNRDIFDVWFLADSNWPINKEIIKLRTNLNYNDFINECIQLIEKKSNRGILFGMGELLDEKQKNWAKTNLKNDTLFQLKLLLENNKH